MADSRRDGSGPPSTSATATPGRLLNREFSLLEYQSRILTRAEDASLPLLERVTALHYFAAGLDDFFQIRVAGLKERVDAAPAAASPDGLTPEEQLAEIRRRTELMMERQSRLWNAELRPALAGAGIQVVDGDGLSEGDSEILRRYFLSRIFPVLTPLAVDPAHPFPYISHLSLNLGAIVSVPPLRHFARLKVPPLLPRFIGLPDGRRFVPLERVIAGNLDTLFPGLEIAAHAVFRVTRDHDLEVRDDAADDLMVTVETELLRRRRGARAVRLEINPDMPGEVRERLLRELDLDDRDVYEVDSMLDLGGVDFLARLDRPDLKARSYTPATPARLGERAETPAAFFEAVREGDILLHHPYDSFATTVVGFLQQAARDPQVLAIKQTMYRTSGPTSAIAMALVHAAEEGKQVVALVELKARGDEHANIEWARRLEEAGAHVVYGLVGLKTHAKLMLVVRQEGDDVRRYVHAGTGNYNPATAKGYEDLGLLSCDPALGTDVSEAFNLLTGYSRQREYLRLLMAPVNLRSSLLEMIAESAAARGRIVLKVNNLIDPGIVEALYEASAAGSEIDLIVRGMCGLRPGVPGLSERIRVRSLVGRFLEHSRVFCFGNGEGGARLYIGSADMMERNLDRRVEALVPVTDPATGDLVREILEVELADDVNSWELDGDGRWHRVATVRGVDAQRRFMELAQERGQHHDQTRHL